MQQKIETEQAAEAAVLELHGRLDDEGPEAGLAFAESLQGDERLLRSIRALAYSDAGERLRDRQMLARAIEFWRALDPASDPRVAYNFAVTQQQVWDLARSEDIVNALEGERSHLYEARQLYRDVGSNLSAEPDMRLQSWTNLGNSLDHSGRDVDALDAYDEALSVDPDFAMAHGNRGITLLAIAPHAGEHRSMLLYEAAIELDLALQDQEGLIRYGGPAALAALEKHRGAIKGSKPNPDDLPAPVRLSDPHLEWSRRHGLLLHPSHRCVRDETDPIDSIFFRGVTIGLSDEAQAHLNDLIDAFGTLKQDYVAARYLGWLSEDAESPVAEHTTKISERVKFLDSLAYVRWGVRTGLATQALAATLNLLDKVASFVHLYLGTGKSRLYFRDIWHPRPRNAKTAETYPGIVQELRLGNRGLLALCDLSCDLEQDTPLAGLVEMRHAATHRFLVSHEMLVEQRTPVTDWVQRVSHHELLDSTRQLLHIARAALLYLARTVDIRESRERSNHAHGKPQGESAMPGWKPTLSLHRAMTEPADW